MQSNDRGKSDIDDAESRFQEASARMLASVQDHINDYESSSSEEECPESDNVLSNVLSNYTQAVGGEYELGRTKYYLEKILQSGTAVCLICISTVKRADAIWTCNSCYTFFHLVCIQKWARDTIFQQEAGIGEPSSSQSKMEWCCPKCRNNYEAVDIPDKYRCFCLKEVDPQVNSWILPHTCGEMCSKPLVPSCNHNCKMLCHPGPCPPCPQMVVTKCHCGKCTPKPVRCSASSYSCGKKCGKLLSCKIHECKDNCHAGPCKECPKKSLQYCVCKELKDQRPCSEPMWKCTKVCDQILDCGNHKCEIVCHANGQCQQCQFSGLKSCPCGSTKANVECPNEVPCCGDTCAKDLPCGLHSCPNKCHKDECPPCLVLTNKNCRCGTHLKETPCSKEFICSKKCGKLKECGRHTCSKKCCPSTCTPCDRLCQRPLKCGKHKCLSFCHNGACYPCPLMGEVSCRCGASSLLVLCGLERRTKPPKCKQICMVPAICKHKEANKHKCHFGPCPMCQQICGAVLPCGHGCKQKCHACFLVVEEPAVKPATPVEVGQRKVLYKEQPCNPCEALVSVECVGNHEEYMQICSQIRPISCGRACGRKLKCTNHFCQLICHPVSNGNNSDNREVSKQNTICEECTRDCQFARPVLCRHACSLGRCHPGDCPACQKITRLRCHCGLTEVYPRCNIISENESKPEEKEKMLCCGGQCTKLLLCGHRCQNVCHSGECPTDQICLKKVKVYCACRETKKEAPCNTVELSGSNVPCTEICDEIHRKKEAAEREKLLKRKQEEDRKNEKELQEFKHKFGKKKYKEYKPIQMQVQVPFWKKMWFLMLMCMLFAGVLSIYLFLD